MTGKVIRIREVGDPILKEICREVDLVKDKKYIKETIKNLKATFEYIGGVGIAAPQIGESIRIIVIGIKKEFKFKGAQNLPVTIMINPVITVKNNDDTYEEYEGCFSAKDIRGKVKRYNKIDVEFYNEKFQKEIWSVSECTAKVIQHECDHLDGIIFMEKVTDTKSYATVENVKKFELM